MSSRPNRYRRCVAEYSSRITGRQLEALLDDIGRFVRGEPLRNVVDKEKWY
jgi:hypothetical protein